MNSDKAYETLKEIFNNNTAYDRGLDDGYNKALDDLIDELEQIDSCEFAMYTLCLIKEKAEQLRRQYDKLTENTKA